MTKTVIIIASVALLFLITTIIFARMYFKQKKKTDQENTRATTAEKQTENIKGRVLENEAFQKNNNTDSFNASIELLHDIAHR